MNSTDEPRRGAAEQADRLFRRRDSEPARPRRSRRTSRASSSAAPRRSAASSAKLRPRASCTAQAPPTTRIEDAARARSACAMRSRSSARPSRSSARSSPRGPTCSRPSSIEELVDAPGSRDAAHRGRGRGGHGARSSACRGRTSSRASRRRRWRPGRSARCTARRLEGGDRVVVKVQRPNAGARHLPRPRPARDVRRRRRPTGRRSVSSSTCPPSSSTSPRRSAGSSTSAMEARNIERMRDVLDRYPRLEVPGVYGELVEPRLLVMEEVEGVPVREAPVGEARREAAQPAARVVLPPDPDRGLLPRRSAPRQPQVVGRADLLPRLRDGRRGRRRATREHLLLMLMAFWRERRAVSSPT